MDPLLRATLTSWDWRIEVILVFAVAASLYTRGWWRLRRRTSGRQGRSRWHASALWRPVAYVGGLLILGIALMSPIDVLASQLFTFHMVQHVLLVMVVPPLLLLANPLPFTLWGLPESARTPAGGLLRRKSTFRRFLEKTTGAGLVWMMFVIVYWGWHDPNAYDLALRSAFVHDLEHISFFLVSVLFWWHAMGAAPHIHKPMTRGIRFAYLISAFPVTMVAGLAITFAKEPIYSYYEAMPRLWGISVMDDQSIAGVIMWVLGGMMYIIAALVIAARWLQGEEAKPALPEATWATEDALAVPGFKAK
ncbi:MAG: cytochrome c oxidase assembly protein [Candidatus Promineifilaceae bacterium]